MFKIQEIDPAYYRKQTRKSTLMIMAVYIVIGFITAKLTVTYLGGYYSNHTVLNLSGAFIGLFIIFWIVNTFFKDANWMKESMYGWRLKRHLMYIYNALTRLQNASDQGDVNAIKILRFYQLATKQMYRFDNNSYGLIELQSQMQKLESKMKEMGIEINQTEFDMASMDDYRK